MPAQRVVAIHQPNFFPWLGFFDKLARTDVFVVMDGVQFSRGGAGNWSNRVRVLVQGQPAWIGVPVHRAGTGPQPIRDVRVVNEIPWRTRLATTLRTNYGRAPHFRDVFPFVVGLIEYPTESLAELNLNAIQAIASAIRLDVSRMVRQGGLAGEGEGTDLLISLVRAAGGTSYLCGDGAGGYIEAEKFGAAGLDLRFQQFTHPTYPQGRTSPFVPGLSIVDALMHCGFDGVGSMFVSVAE